MHTSHVISLGLELVQQCLRLLEIRCVKALGEPVVHRGEQVVGLLALALVLPQARQAGGSAEFPRTWPVAGGPRRGPAENRLLPAPHPGPPAAAARSP